MLECGLRMWLYIYSQIGYQHNYVVHLLIHSSPFMWTFAVDDPCDAAPCANSGTCSRTGFTEFSCACEGNWSGPTCDSEL